MLKKILLGIIFVFILTSTSTLLAQRPATQPESSTVMITEKLQEIIERLDKIEKQNQRSQENQEQILKELGVLKVRIRKAS